MIRKLLAFIFNPFPQLWWLLLSSRNTLCCSCPCPLSQPCTVINPPSGFWHLTVEAAIPQTSSCSSSAYGPCFYWCQANNKVLSYLVNWGSQNTASFSSSAGFLGPRSKMRRCPNASPDVSSRNGVEAGGESAVSKAVHVPPRLGSWAGVLILVLFKCQKIVAFLVEPFWCRVVLLGVMKPHLLQGTMSALTFWSWGDAESLSGEKAPALQEGENTKPLKICVDPTTPSLWHYCELWSAIL